MTFAEEIQSERISEEVAPGIVMQGEVMGSGKKGKLYEDE